MKSHPQLAKPQSSKRPKRRVISTTHAHDDNRDTQQDVADSHGLSLSPRECEQGSQRLPPEHAAGKVIKECIFRYVRSWQYNPLSPFANVYEYKLARFFHDSKISLKQIDKFFKNNLLPIDRPETASVQFKSGHTWRNKIRELIDQPPWHRGTVDFHLQQGCIFYYWDVQHTIAYLLQQRTFAGHLVYEPVQDFDKGGNRMYTYMHTGNWWWRTQVWS
ncbi:hypothetical protein BGX38DRAFT_1146209 [Terfezia claveryi]|nr:hypothetical protein BGX38DRAFT_1146209 [Terfezia claveryi]